MSSVDRPSRRAARNAVVRIVSLIPWARRHIERDRRLALERRSLDEELRHTRHERDAQAAALAARAADDGGPGALPIGDDVDLPSQPPLTAEDRAVVDAFHDLYYSRWRAGADTINVSWLGWRALKCPLDLWTYQELVVKLRPAIVVETGTHLGGSAMFLASILDLVGAGEVVSVDILDNPRRPRHPRIRYITGSSVDPAIVGEVTAIVAGRPCIVIFDSDHSRDHVLAELRAYADCVPVGSYLVVEDSNVNGHPTWPDWGPGPWEAVEAFLAEDPRFVRDPDMERFLLTLNPGGFLRRVR